MATRPTPADIRDARAANPKLRARDLADQLSLSEAEYVAAWCGHGTRRIGTDFDAIFPKLEAVGEVMALTRNASAVHEKIGVYDKFHTGRHAAMMLGETIDMRMFPAHWVHGFAVEEGEGGETRRSLQFFDAHGEAVHKVHLRPASDVDAWQRLVESVTSANQEPVVEVAPVRRTAAANDGNVPVDLLQRRWRAMTDTHQFVGILRKLEISRLTALSHIGDDFAWRLDNSSVEAMMRLSAAEQLNIMCFVGNRGCIQIHSGPISEIKTMGPWINILDPGFHMHLRADRIAQAWAVRKPTDKGHVTSLEAYDANGDLIIQFFGKRIEGMDERPGWRTIMEGLPRVESSRAA